MNREERRVRGYALFCAIYREFESSERDGIIYHVIKSYCNEKKLIDAQADIDVQAIATQKNKLMCRRQRRSSDGSAHARAAATRRGRAAARRDACG